MFYWVQPILTSFVVVYFNGLPIQCFPIKCLSRISFDSGFKLKLIVLLQPFPILILSIYIEVETCKVKMLVFFNKILKAELIMGLLWLYKLLKGSDFELISKVFGFNLSACQPLFYLGTWKNQQGIVSQGNRNLQWP